MKNPYDGRDYRAAEALEELVSAPADYLLTCYGSMQQHTDFELPDNNGALVVVRFTGQGAVEKAIRLRKLIDAWS